MRLGFYQTHVSTSSLVAGVFKRHLSVATTGVEPLNILSPKRHFLPFIGVPIHGGVLRRQRMKKRAIFFAVMNVSRNNSKRRIIALPDVMQMIYGKKKMNLLKITSFWNETSKICPSTSCCGWYNAPCTISNSAFRYMVVYSRFARAYKNFSCVQIFDRFSSPVFYRY